jgi:hypothetical protein
MMIMTAPRNASIAVSRCDGVAVTVAVSMRCLVLHRPPLAQNRRPCPKGAKPGTSLAIKDP